MRIGDWALAHSELQQAEARFSNPHNRPLGEARGILNQNITQEKAGGI